MEEGKNMGVKIIKTEQSGPGNHIYFKKDTYAPIQLRSSEEAKEEARLAWNYARKANDPDPISERQLRSEFSAYWKLRLKEIQKQMESETIQSKSK